MTHALPDGRLTWNVAVPWGEEDLASLGNKRYITLGNEEPAPEGRLERCAVLRRTMLVFFGDRGDYRIDIVLDSRLLFGCN